MSNILRGASATFLSIATSALLTACAGDDADDGATSVAQTSTDTEPASESTTAAPESSGSTADESSTTETPGETSGSSSDGPVDTSGESGTTDSGAAALEIAGAWSDNFGGEHVIDDVSWTDIFPPDTFTYSISEFDNAERFIIAQDDGDSTWSKFEWTYVQDDLYYCQSAYGESSAEEALAAMDADPTDPTSAGCGGFSWSQLVPQR